MSLRTNDFDIKMFDEHRFMIILVIYSLSTTKCINGNNFFELVVRYRRKNVGRKWCMKETTLINHYCIYLTENWIFIGIVLIDTKNEQYIQDYYYWDPKKSTLLKLNKLYVFLILLKIFIRVVILFRKSELRNKDKISRQRWKVCI